MKGQLRCYCSPVWVTNGGWILSSVIAICGKFRIFYLMGNHHMKGVPECNLTDQYYRLEQWSNITLFLRKFNLDCINLVQKSCQVYFFGYALFAGRFWKGDIMIADGEELEVVVHARRPRRLDTGWCGSHKWLLVYYGRFQLSPSCWSRVKLYMPREESFFGLKYMDVTRATRTSLDVLLEKYWRLLERGWRKRLVWCMDRVQGHLMDTHSPGRDLQGNKLPLVQTLCGQICGSICLMERERKQKRDGRSRNQSSTMPDNWEEYSSLSQTMKNSSSHKVARRNLEVSMKQECLVKYP